MTTKKFIFIALIAFISVICFFQIDSALADKYHLNWPFAILGSIGGVYAIISLIIGYKNSQ